MRCKETDFVGRCKSVGVRPRTLADFDDVAACDAAVPFDVVVVVVLVVASVVAVLVVVFAVAVVVVVDVDAAGVDAVNAAAIADSRVVAAVAAAAADVAIPVILPSLRAAPTKVEWRECHGWRR